MPQPTSRAIDSAWAAAFKDAICRKREPQGAGWKTYEQLKNEYKMGRNRTHDIICKLVKEGKLERFDGTVHNGTRAVRQVWYRPKGLDSPQTVKTR